MSEVESKKENINTTHKKETTPEKKKEKKEKKRDSNNHLKPVDGNMEKAKKNLASKAATSTLGKKLLTKVLDDQANLLMKSLKNIIERQTDRKKAKEIQNTIIRLLVKAHSSIKSKKVSEKQFFAADRPLRKTFRRCVRLTAAYQDIKLEPEKLKENYTALSAHLAQVQAIVAGVLESFLSDKNKKNFADTIAFLSNPEFLAKVWADEKNADDLQKMSSAMKKYLEHPSRAPPKDSSSSSSSAQAKK